MKRIAVLLSITIGLMLMLGIPISATTTAATTAATTTADTGKTTAAAQGEVNSSQLSSESISASSAIIIEAKTGRVIFAKNEKEKRPMASTTKIMTTLLTLESGDLDKPFVVDSEAIKVEGSSMGLVEGDTVTRRVLCYGMLLPSGNDGANAAAVNIAGSLPAFSALMNKRASEIGMADTAFITASGLHEDEHYSTALDMVKLARIAMENENFRNICSQKQAEVSFGNPPYSRTLKNTNKMLDQYEGSIGIKTGFTDEAGRCLISAAERDGITLIAVTLKAPDDWNDHKKMFNYGFSITKKQALTIPPGIQTINVVGGLADVAKIKTKTPSPITTVGEELSAVKTKIVMPRFIYAPMKADEEVGKVNYYLNDKLIESAPIVLAEDCLAKNPTK